MNTNSAKLSYLPHLSVKKVASASFYVINEQGQEVKITQQMIDNAYKTLRQCRYLPRFLGH